MKNIEQRLEIIEREIAHIRSLYDRTLSYRDADPATALMHARRAAEAICRQLFVCSVSPNPGNLMLEGFIEKLTASGVLPRDIAIPLRTIQGYGNYAAHAQGEDPGLITPTYIRPCLEALSVVVDWYVTNQQKPGHNLSSRGPEITPARGHAADEKGPSVSPSSSVGEFAGANGITPSAVIRLARDILKLELRTHSALLTPEQQEALRIGLAERNGGATTGPQSRALEIGGGERIEFILIPAGRFVMGSPVTEEGHNDDEVEHPVVIPRPFYISRAPVTQRQYFQLTRSNPSYFRGEDLPAEMVSWFDAESFASVLTERLGRRFRLPTEAEWEYCCRAGTRTAFGHGPKLSTNLANFDGKIDGPADGSGVARWKTTPVMGFPPNPWSLHDMHGNVWEWCSDWYGEYPRKECVDPRGPNTGDIKVLRGGSWFHGAADARSAQRDALDPGRRHSIYGFRLAFDGGAE